MPARTASANVSELADFPGQPCGRRGEKTGDAIWVKCIGIDRQRPRQALAQSRDERPQRSRGNRARLSAPRQTKH